MSEERQQYQKDIGYNGACNQLRKKKKKKKEEREREREREIEREREREKERMKREMMERESGGGR